MKKTRKVPPKTFRQAVYETPDIAEGYETGLVALGQHSSRIDPSDPRLLQGSVDIDARTTAKYPNANRWDYALAYIGEFFFVEVHSANSGEVRTVLKKFRWLKDWLHTQAPEINKLRASGKFPFYWIQSKNFAIPKTSPQYKAADGAGLKPIAKLLL